MNTLLKIVPAVALLTFAQDQIAVADIQCMDACQLDQVLGTATCRLWDSAQGNWIEEIDTGAGQLHNRARAYLPWLRDWMMPAGGVMSTFFTDTDYHSVTGYGGERDSAIWTGAYLAAESLRHLSTGAPDAQTQIAKTLGVLHRWWTISGDPGYLARFAAPSDSSPEILATLPANESEVHLGQPYEGALWNWRGNVSRDQYQGVLLGYSLAYEATADASLRALIRADVVAFVEQLMQREQRNVAIVINGQSIPVSVDLENVVYATSEMVDGMPALTIDLSTQEVQGQGLLVFWPNPSEFLRQIPVLSWLPDMTFPTQAIQLASAFSVALQVTEDVDAYAERRQAIADYYDEHFATWLEIASGWQNTNDCGDSYHGLNIAFMPLFNWARLESDPVRREQIRQAVLGDRMWPAVADHKNVFFAFIYASQAPIGADISTVVSSHVAQLAEFPSPPNAAVAVDLRGSYPENPSCPGDSAIAIDVGDRIPATFMWEKQPWKLQSDGNPLQLYGGVDYLLAYWMGRRFGFIAEDAPGTCLAYSDAPPGGVIPTVTANDVSNSLTLSSGSLLSVNVMLHTNTALTGLMADWWAAAATDQGWFSYRHPQGDWTYVGDSPQNLMVTHQGPLGEVSGREILHTDRLSAGSYRIYFGVDTNMNGVLDLGQAYYDEVEVDIR